MLRVGAAARRVVVHDYSNRYHGRTRIRRRLISLVRGETAVPVGPGCAARRVHAKEGFTFTTGANEEADGREPGGGG